MANLNLLMSIGTIALLILWFFRPGPLEGWKLLKVNRTALAMVGLFLIHIVWVINTEDLAYAAKDLRIKLPLLVFAVVLGGSNISRKQVKYVFAALAAGIWLASIRAYITYLSINESFYEFRGIVQGISHIRLSLMMVLVLAAIFHYRREFGPVLKALAVLTVLNILLFFNILQSASGIIITVIVLVFSLFYAAKKRKGAVGVVAVALILAVVGVAAGIGVKDYYSRYFTSEQSYEGLPTHTASGNPYSHNTSIGQVENGHYTFLYVAEYEMAKAWEERSDHAVMGDERILERAALIRYLTSKGLTKDRQGVEALSEKDVDNIEKGFPSVVYTTKSGLALRFHTTVFGYHQFRVTENAGGSSLFQRLVFWKAATVLISENFWTGTGTGDLKKAFIDIYDESNMNLAEQYRLRAHNQFLTFFVSFGLVGFIYFFAMFLVPFFGGKVSYLHMAFLLIAFVACLTEDTLETQAGVTFFSFFYGLLSARMRSIKSEFDSSSGSERL